MLRRKTIPMLCSMCVYYLNVLCLSFVSETKVLYVRAIKASLWDFCERFHCVVEFSTVSS